MFASSLFSSKFDAFSSFKSHGWGSRGDRCDTRGGDDRFSRHHDRHDCHHDRHDDRHQKDDDRHDDDGDDNSFFSCLDKFSCSGHGTHGSVTSRWSKEACDRSDRNEDEDDCDTSSRHDDDNESCGFKGGHNHHHHHDHHDDDACTEAETEEDTTQVEDDGDFEVVELPNCDLPEKPPVAAGPKDDAEPDEEDNIAGLPLIDLPDQASDQAEEATADVFEADDYV